MKLFFKLLPLTSLCCFNSEGAWVQDQVVTFQQKDQKPQTHKIKAFYDADRFRMEMKTPVPGKDVGSVSVIMVSNERGTFACPQIAQGPKTCTKTPGMGSPDMAVMPGMGGKRVITEYSVRPKGISKTIAGRKCDEYDVKSTMENAPSDGGKPKVEVVVGVFCLAKIEGLKTSIFNNSKSVSADMFANENARNEFARVKELGFPMELAMDVSNGKMSAVTSSLSERKLDPSMFEVPKGYKVVDLSQLGDKVDPEQLKKMMETVKHKK